MALVKASLLATPKNISFYSSHRQNDHKHVAVQILLPIRHDQVNEVANSSKIPFILIAHDTII